MKCLDVAIRPLCRPRADGTVACGGDICRVPARVTNAVAVGASARNVWAVSTDGAVDVWGGSFRPGGLRVAAKGPAQCEILDACVTDAGLCLLLVRARAGLLEGDADGDGASGVEEAFLYGTDPLVKDFGDYAPVSKDATSPSAARPATDALKSETPSRALQQALFSYEAGTTYYVNAARSDDTGDGLSWDGAKRTIQAAVNIAQPGDISAGFTAT
jgi:hypothetical protein